MSSSQDIPEGLVNFFEILWWWWWGWRGGLGAGHGGRE